MAVGALGPRAEPIDRGDGGIVSTRAVGGAETLPATGNGTEPWLLGHGAASVLAGFGLVHRSRNH